MIRDPETLQALLDNISRFVRERLVPNENLVAETDAIPADIVAEMKALGLFGLCIPEEFGGLGLTMEEEVCVAFELGRTSPAFRSMFGTNNGIGSQGIIMDGTPEQQAAYLHKLAAGEMVASFALTEPGSGSDAGSARMTATKKGNEWVLNGTKTFITNGHYADVCVVIAVTDKTAHTHGLSAFIVEKDTKGFRAGKKENKLGLRASDTAELIFEDCVIPAANLVGKEGDGFVDSMRVLDGGRISIAALSLGIGQGAYEAALKYSKERKQFGKAIADFQAIQWKLADMATELDAARLLTMRAADMKDKGMKTTQESSMAKLYASEVAVRCANEGVQIHGGYGFIKDYPAEKYYRDVKLCTIGEGTSEIQRLIIAREILNK